MDLSVNVIYHYPCYDGLFSCLPLHLYYQHFPSTEVHYYPYRTNKPFTQTLHPASIVYLLDCIGTKDMLEELIQTARKIVVLDHHYQVREIVASWSLGDDSLINDKVDFSYVRSDICAAKIAWSYFTTLNNAPLLPDRDDLTAVQRVIDYVEDRDLYHNSLPDTRKVSCGLRDLYLSHRLPNLDLRTGTTMLDRATKVTVRLAIQQGAGLTGHRTKEITEELYKPMWKVAIGGDPSMVCLGIATQKKHLRSEIGTHLAELSEKVFHIGVGITIISEGDPHIFRLSLRSICEVNVAEIAIEYGGGGHPGAAGMTINTEDFRRNWLKGQVVKSRNSDTLISFS